MGSQKRGCQRARVTQIETEKERFGSKKMQER